jgi:hypothetical protein
MHRASRLLLLSPLLLPLLRPIFLRRKQLTLIYRQSKNAHCVTLLVLPASDDISEPRRRIL